MGSRASANRDSKEPVNACLDCLSLKFSLRHAYSRTSPAPGELSARLKEDNVCQYAFNNRSSTATRQAALMVADQNQPQATHWLGFESFHRRRRDKARIVQLVCAAKTAIGDYMVVLHRAVFASGFCKSRKAGTDVRMTMAVRQRSKAGKPVIGF